MFRFDAERMAPLAVVFMFMSTDAFAAISFLANNSYTNYQGTLTNDSTGESIDYSLEADLFGDTSLGTQYDMHFMDNYGVFGQYQSVRNLSSMQISESADGQRVSILNYLDLTSITESTDADTTAISNGYHLFDFQFSIDTAYDYQLVTRPPWILGDDLGLGVSGSGSVSYQLLDAMNGDTVYSDSANDMFTVSDTGVLLPGTYRVLLEATTDQQLMGVTDGQVFNSASGEITLLLEQSAVVPVPAAAWLFISGLFGLLGYARRSS